MLGADAEANPKEANQRQAGCLSSYDFKRQLEGKPTKENEIVLASSALVVA